jgi:hypothetical protein
MALTATAVSMFLPIITKFWQSADVVLRKKIANCSTDINVVIATGSEDRSCGLPDYSTV